MNQGSKSPRKTPDLRKETEARLQSRAPGFQEFSADEINVLLNELQVHQIELERQNDALRQSQISLEEINRKYRDFYDFAPVGFLTLDESGLIREANLTAAGQLGVTMRHLVDKPFRSFIAVEDRRRFHLHLQLVFQEPGPQSDEIRLQQLDGGHFFAHLDSIAVTDVDGARVCRTFITDISNLKQAEEKLRASERLFASFVGHLPSVAVIRDLEGRYLFANAAWEQTLQKRRQEWLGKTSEELWPPEVAARFREQDRLVMESGEALQTITSLAHPDGLHQWIYYRFPIVDQEGTPVMIGVHGIDVTEPMAIKAQLEHVLNSGSAAIYTCDPRQDLAFSYISENIKTLVGWEARDFLADSRFWLQQVHPEDRPMVCNHLELPWPEDRRTLEYRFLAKNGAYRWMHDEARLVRDQNGKPVEITGVWMEITARRQVEETLRVSLRILELVHNFTDLDSLLNAFVSEIKNYTGCAAVGIRVLDAAGAMPYQASIGFHQQFCASGNPLSIHTDHCMCTDVIKGAGDPELPFYTAGGSFWMNQTSRFLAKVSEQDQWRIREVCNLEGYESVAMIPFRCGDHILGLIHIADPRENMVPLELVQMLEKAASQLGVVFERVRAEKAQRESEEKYRLLVRQIPAVVFKGYQDWSIDFFDRKIEHLTGYSREEFDSGQRKWCDLILPEDLDMARRLFKRALETDKSYVREYRIRKKDGEIAWIQSRAQIFCDTAGQVEYVSGVFFDITARKAAETRIHQERQKFFSLLDMLPALVCVVTPDYTVPFANRRFREILGDPEGRTCYELSYGRQTPCDGCKLKKIMETQKPVEWERTSHQGRTYHIHTYPFADIDGSPMVIKLGMDITARKTLESQLLQAQKMEAVGRLAGGVAHDFNNLLMAIMGYGELIRTSLVKDDPLYKYSEDILKATERAASLTQQLLAFSRKQMMQPQVFCLNRVVGDLEKMLRRLIGEHIELEIVADPNLGIVTADPNQINQIIMNLAVNARDAMPRGGRLILATDNIDFAASHKCYSAAAPPGRYIRLTVTDTGSGMEAETLEHMFEPFFTTKEMGKGTGLGLPMVYGIVKQNHGYIEVDSRPGQGATFKIYLPRIEAPAKEAPGAGVSLAAKLEGSETILVVEDEDALRTLLCRFFRLYGYNVLEARHGGEALLLCERHPEPIQLMITDVVMPQMSGKELADRLAPLRPEMTVFFMSGYTDSDLSGYGAPASSKHFITKPFRPMDLVKKVRDFLDASRGGHG